MNRRRQASIFDFGTTKKRRTEYPLSPPSSSPIKREECPSEAEELEKTPVPFDLSACMPAHLKSGINTISSNASLLSRLQWREMEGVQKHLMYKIMTLNKYEETRGVAVTIEDCHVPILSGTSASNTGGFWVGTQDGQCLHINTHLQHVGGIQVHNNAILDMSSGAGLPDFLATASGDKSVILWETAQSENVAIRQYYCGNGGSIRKVASHDSAQLLAAASRSGSVSIIDARATDPIMTLHTNAHHTLFGKGPRLTKVEKGLKPGITAIDWITDTTLATACGLNSEIRIWDTRYLKQDGHTGIMEVEGRANRPVALFQSEANAGITDIHYDRDSRILYSVGHKTVCGYSCDYGAYIGQDTAFSPSLDSHLPPVLSAAVDNRSFYSASSITEGYLAVGEGSDTVNIFALPDSIGSLRYGMRGTRIAADSGSMVNVNGAMEIAALNWVDDILMGCTDAGVVFRIDHNEDRI
ncbi:hypothetical protein CJU89_4103 [Yarrowia sp. B02]|nr:hypothetical protein CJU89_4103 [Yarrowia sp. B02]